MQQETSKPKPSSSEPSTTKKVIASAVVAILAAVWFYFLVVRAVQIAQDIAANWWLELFILLGAAFLLFSKRGGHENRFIVEAALFLAALMVFIAKSAIGNH